MLRKPGESFMYRNVKMVTFIYNNKHIPVNRNKADHRCYICSFGSQGNTKFGCHCGDSCHQRGECASWSVFLTRKDFQKSTREQKSLISVNPNKFK